ncbi:retrovirus-related pol polyprotein from transposon TNT 1-94 [Tanacetum coccineum]
MINCTKINLDNKSVNDTLTTDLERYKEQVKVLKDGQNVYLKSNNNVLDSSARSVEIDRLKQTLSEHLKEKESLMQTVTLLKNDFKKEESRNIDREIALEKRIQKPRLNICYEIPDSKRPLLLADEIVRKEQWNYYEKADILMNHFVAILYSTNGVIQRTEAVATTCYTQNRSIIRRLHGKTPYDILHYKLPDLSFFYVFGALCYPTNDSENLGKLQPKADIDFDELTAMASEHSSSGPALHEMTPATIKHAFVSNGLTFITTVDQDAPSPSNSQTTPDTQSPIIPNDIEAMEEELNEFERLKVWELVPRPDKVMVITLKWIYKVKLDEVRGILKNKARLVARGYRQEEGINFEESFALVARS